MCSLVLLLFVALSATAQTSVISTFAGNGTYGYLGDGGPATAAALNMPGSIAFDPAGNVYIADVYGNNVVRMVDSKGIITTFAGNGAKVFQSPVGNGGPATSAQINPCGLAVDAAGNVYISDSSNGQIRKVDAQGVITAFAGTGTQGYSGDNGPATSAQLNFPEGIAFDAAGNLYIADQYNRRVRKVDTKGIITTFAGDGNAPPAGFGNAGDGGPAISAHMVHVRNLAVDSQGNLYIAEADSTPYAPQPTSRIRKVDTHGNISTVAGIGAVGFSGDGGVATSARLGSYLGIAVDTAGILYIADTDANRVRKVDLSGVITTIAGTGSYGFTGDGGPPAAATLAGPAGAAVDTTGNLYISEQFNVRVRKIGSGPAASQQSVTASAGTPQSTVVSTAFLIALKVIVKDSSNHVASGVAVTFTAPATGPSAVFGNAVSATTTTTAAGVATAPVLTANATAGTYSVVATAAGGGQSTFTLTNTGGKLVATPATIAFTCQSGGPLPASKTVNIVRSDGGSYTAVASDSSLSVTPPSGTLPSTLTVALVDSLACSTTATARNRSIQISSAGAATTPLNVPVTLTITPAPKITVTPAKLIYVFALGGTAPVAQTVNVIFAGTGNIDAVAGAAWLSVTPATGAAPATFSVAVDTTGLAAGTYTGAVNFTNAGAGNSPFALPVTLTVSGPPTIVLSPAQLDFSFQLGGTAPQSQAVTLTMAGKSAYTVTESSAWMSVSPASGTGTAKLAVSVTAAGLNPGTYSSTITVAVAGATNTPQTVPVTLIVSTACSYLLQPDPVPMIGQQGGGSLFQVITAQGCPWSVRSSVSWITLNSVSSGAGNGAISFKVAANTSGASRNGIISLGGQGLTITQAGGAPLISTGGVVNVASYASASAAGGIAQGSFFSIFGSNLGPDKFAKATSYPLPVSLGGVSVDVVQGAQIYKAYLVYASSSQINALLPSGVPVGSTKVVVNYGGQSSSAADIVVAATSLGIFYQSANGANLAIAQNVASATDYPLNLPSVPAKPGQIVILWGTGLGAVAGGDDVAPGTSAVDMASVPVTITVGGVTAQRVYAGRQPSTAGVDNIYFTIPQAGVTFGCQVPLVVTAGGVAANTTVIAITSDGTACKGG